MSILKSLWAGTSGALFGFFVYQVVNQPDVAFYFVAAGAMLANHVHVMQTWVSNHDD